MSIFGRGVKTDKMSLSRIPTVRCTVVLISFFFVLSAFGERAGAAASTGLSLSQNDLLWIVGIMMGLIPCAYFVGRSKPKKESDLLRQTTRETQERELWYRDLLDAAPDATLIVDQKGIIVSVNKQAEIVFAADRDKLLGQSIDMLVPDDVQARHVAYRDAFVMASAPREMGANRKLMAKRTDGTEFPVEISLSPISRNGSANIVASVRDVTARRQAEKELSKKEALLRAVVDNMSSGVMMVDSDLNVQVFNRRYLEMFDLRDVQPGMPFQDLMRIRALRGDYGMGDPTHLVEKRIEYLKSNSLSVSEDRLSDGSFIETRRAQIEGGGIVSLYNDVTKRILAEKTLEEKSRSLSRMNDTLSRYLSPQICQQIVSGEQDAEVRTSRKRLTVFFSDIVSFTSTTEGYEPEEITLLLNDYLTKMSEIALAFGGTIDKYIGDAILIFFGDPDTNGVKQDAVAAVQMAIEMQRRLADLRAKWEDFGYKKPFRIRCGITTGYCNVGNFGSSHRVDYTIIGSQVNLAARLESECPPDGIFIADSTYRLARDVVRAEPQDPVQVKGIRDPVVPYSVKGIFDEWDEDERYLRRETDGLRLWVDLKHMSEDERAQTVSQLEDAAGKLKTFRLRAVNDSDEEIA